MNILSRYKRENNFAETMEKILKTKLSSKELHEIDHRLRIAYNNNEYWSELSKLKAEYGVN